MRLYYVQGRKPVPIDKIKEWYIEGNKAVIIFEEKSFIDGTQKLEFVYQDEEEAKKDMNWMWEWWAK